MRAQVPGTKYEIDDRGVIYGRQGRPIFQKRDKDGYAQVQLSVNGRMRFPKVHRLVAIAFIPNPENKPQVNHKNGIKDDNRAENLEWVLPRENIRHAVETGLIKRGGDSPRAKLSWEDADHIREEYAAGGVTMVALAAKYGVGPFAIAQIIHRRRYVA
jgi:hypothetical protein